MHPSDGRVVSDFIVQALKNQPVTIFGEGHQTRSFCYVADLIEAIIRLMGTSESRTVGKSGQSRRIYDSAIGGTCH